MTVEQNNLKKKILIIEDEPAIAENIFFAVETESMIPLMAETIGEAQALLDEHTVSLVVLDVGLPDGNGFDFCRLIRAGSNVPIIFLTARREEVDRIVGLELGADDYMTKPFSPRELTARIRAILRRTELSSPAVDVRGQKTLFEVDHHSKTISFDGQPLVLSRYEFGMLELLSKNPRRIYSREQLMNYAWSEPEASFDRTVDTHIKTLRVKLRAIRPDLNPIQTRRGFGYFLKVDG